uniref:Integral membrane protein 2 n=1 Tax=Sinocyclocheilus grahami TaxID=75366 RepID=A0A672NIV4_SINGR
MVKVSFNKALAFKDPKKESLILDVQDSEAAVLVRPQSKVWCWCFCLGLALVLSGVVVGGAFLYRYYMLEISTWKEFEAPLMLLEENVSFFEDDEVELIKVPVPEFRDGDSADFQEFLVNIKAGMYLPQTYLMREEMMVTERLDSTSDLGYYINDLCKDKDTYRLQRRDIILGMQKREALNCHKIRHFENKFVVETLICEQ